MSITYYDDKGTASKQLYEKAFGEQKDVYDYVMDENDPRYKLRKIMEEKEWEKFKNKHKIPLAIYSPNKRNGDQYEEENKLPYNPDLIVVPEDPKERIRRKRDVIVKLSSDLPRRENMFIYKRQMDTYLDSLNNGLENIEEREKLMLVNEINMLHPRKFDMDGRPSRYKWCSDTLGFFGWKDDWLFNDFNKYGVGLGDAFRTIKWLLFFWIIISALSIAHCFYMFQSNPLFNYSNIKTALYTISLGNVYKGVSMCNQMTVASIITNDPITHILKCPNDYRIRKEYITSFGVSTAKDLDYCNDYSSNSLLTTDPNCSLRNDIIDLTNCDDTLRQCTITIPLNTFTTKCKSSPTDILSLSYQCYYDNLNNTSLDYINDIAYIIDVIIVILLLTIVIFLYYIHMRSDKIQNENNYQISHYSIHIKNISLSSEPIQFLKDLEILIETLSNSSMYFNIPEIDEYEDVGDFFEPSPIYMPTLPLYQLSYPNFDSFPLDKILERKEILSKYEIPYYDLAGNSTYASEAMNVRYDFKKDQDAVFKKVKSINYDMDFYKFDTANHKIRDVFVTCKSKLHAEKLYNCYRSKNCFTRFWIIMTCQMKRIKQFYYKNSWLNVDYVPYSPDCIKWENMRYSPCKRILRYILVILIMIAMIFVSFGIFYYGIVTQRLFEEEYDNYVNCSMIDITNENNVFTEHYNSLISKKNKVMSSCYCRNKLDLTDENSAEGLFYLRNTEKVFLCKDWIMKLRKMNISYIVIYVLIPILNIIGYALIPFLSLFERHKDIMNERVSSMIKAFILSLFTNGLSIILVNMRINAVYNNIPDFFLFTGHIQNINNVWYYHIGTTITLLLIINIITPYVLEFTKWFIVTLIRKYGMKNIFLERNKYKFLYWFIGPEYLLEVKLGDILGMICLGMLLGNLIPLINYAIIISLFVHFWLGKLLLVSYCKTPHKYTQQLTKTFLIIAYIFIGIKCLLSYWVYSITLDVPDSLGIDNSLLDSFRHLKLIYYLIVPGLMIIVPAFYYISFRCFMFSCCRKCNQSYGFAENAEIEHDVMKDFIIYEALPLSVLYKNYVLRKIEYVNINKYALDMDLTHLLRFYRQRLDTDRAAIYTKLKFITEKECSVDEGFDHKIKMIMDKYKDLEETKVKDDYSYSLGYSPLFSAYFLSEMIK